MCDHCGLGRLSKRDVLTKNEFTPAEERVFQTFLDDYVSALRPLEEDIEAFVAQASDSDLASLESIRSEIQARAGVYTADFDTVFRTNGEEGAAVGRQLAANRQSLDVDFEIVPQRTLDIINEWSSTAAESTLETITEDSARWLRGAHEDGLSIDDIAEQLNDELFEGRLEGYVAERASRTGVVATSNAGNHSAIQDSSAIAEEWVASLDGRERPDHGEADGQIVPVDTAFQVGGVYMQHPGDPTAPVGQIANCRCTVVPVFADQLTDEELDAIESGERIKIVLSGRSRKIAPDGSTEPLTG